MIVGSQRALMEGGGGFPSSWLTPFLHNQGFIRLVLQKVPESSLLNSKNFFDVWLKVHFMQGSYHPWSDSLACAHAQK
eukprot:c34217_g1_i1 orf=529-762(+)